MLLTELAQDLVTPHSHNISYIYVHTNTPNTDSVVDMVVPNLMRSSADVLMLLPYAAEQNSVRTQSTSAVLTFSSAKHLFHRANQLMNNTLIN